MRSPPTSTTRPSAFTAPGGHGGVAGSPARTTRPERPVRYPLTSGSWLPGTKTRGRSRPSISRPRYSKGRSPQATMTSACRAAPLSTSSDSSISSETASTRTIPAVSPAGAHIQTEAAQIRLHPVDLGAGNRVAGGGRHVEAPAGGRQRVEVGGAGGLAPHLLSPDVRAGLGGVEQTMEPAQVGAEPLDRLLGRTPTALAHPPREPPTEYERIAEPGGQHDRDDQPHRRASGHPTSFGRVPEAPQHAVGSALDRTGQQTAHEVAL